MTTNPIDQFRTALSARGILAPAEIRADGVLHRCDADGKGGKNDAAYLLHLDGIPAGGFENHRDGLGWENWRTDIGRTMTAAEEAEHRTKVEALRKQREIDQAKQHAEARELASLILAETYPSDHPYLIKKVIKPYGAKVIGTEQARGISLNLSPELTGLLLVIPVRADGLLACLQFITADGIKRPLTGGKMAGGYHAIGTTKGAAALAICEGFATGATIHEATGYPVAVAFSAGNLLAVAQAMRAKFSDLPLIVCADDDQTAGNPGLTKATEAARAVGGVVAVPAFGADRREMDTDFNDLAALHGLEAVARVITGALMSNSDDAPAVEYARTVDLIRASDVTPEPITWLWNGWLAAGKMHVFGGAPGTGKTTISMGLAATVTTGGRWPDGTRSIAGNVVIWSGEDDPADTLIPRLALSGADLSRVYFIAEIREGSERRSFDPARDMEPLRRKLAEIGGVRLLIVDPIVSAITGDSHKNAEVRRGLQPLVDLAGSMRCALLGITHFSKGTGGRDPVERLTGSLAFGALARVVLVAAKHQEEGDDGRTVRLFCRAKSNIGPDDGGFEYDLHQAELKTHPGIFSSSVLWGDAVEGAARELLATADATGDDGEGGTLAEAKRFLSDLLADSPVPTKAIRADADGAGYAWRTVQRAQKALGVIAVKEGMKGGWVWKLDCAKNANKSEECQQNLMATFGKVGDLRATGQVIEVEL